MNDSLSLDGKRQRLERGGTPKRGLYSVREMDLKNIIIDRVKDWWFLGKQQKIINEKLCIKIKYLGEFILLEHGVKCTENNSLKSSLIYMTFKATHVRAFIYDLESWTVMYVSYNPGKGVKYFGNFPDHCR